MAFDTGFIVAGGLWSPMREIELELKSGELIDLYWFGLSLAEAFPVRLSILSKSERGIALTSGDPAAAVRASVPLTTGQTVDEAMFAAFREEAKRIATAMEDARNRDVFSDLLRRGPRAMLPTETGFDVLMAASDRRREGGYASIRALLVDTTTKRFVLAMQTFVARCGWRTARRPDL